MLRTLALVLILASSFFVTCSSDDGGVASNSGARGGGAGDASAGTSGSGGIIGIDSPSTEIESIAITPADPVIVVENGSIPAATIFTATATLKGGGTTTLTGGQWTYERPDIGTLAIATGSFTATGLFGGSGKVTYKHDQLSGTTSATVKLRFTNDPQGIDDAVKTALSSTSTPDPALALLYPYDRTVFPRGLVGPTIQWNGGNPSDVYYLRFTSPTFEYEEWNTVAAPSRWPFPTAPVDIWSKLTDSTEGATSFVLARWDGSQAYVTPTQTWTIAPANLAGTVYYWEVNQGNVVRLRLGDSAPQDFLQKPPGVGCVACHSVSKNGGTLVGAFNGSASPWGTFDTATGASQFVYGTNPNDGPNGSGFQAIAPDGSLVLWGQSRGTAYLSLSAFNAAPELAQLNPGTGYPVHPAWSGDGKKIAFAVRTNGNWLDFTSSSLWITDIDTSTYTFGNTREIVPNDGSRPTVTFPTFSPDSSWIAFERATQARTRDALSDIWLTNTDGSVVISLDNTNGAGHLQGNDVSSTYEPTFMPVAAGGYFWMIVVTERTYGNTLVDTNRTTRKKQLWVTAIDATPQAGQDPSHPPFWLPGQELDNQNMRGEWALDPCKQVGDSCNSGFQCCTGFCQPDGSGGFACSSDTPSCSQIGEACTSAADCCDPTARCIAGFCSRAPPS
jgi:hypothetical protein